jgi:hypothetical protein
MRLPAQLRTRLLAVLALAIPWVSAPFVLTQVVEHNARSGLYGISDAIAIPIGTAFILFLVGSPFLAVVLGFVLWRLGRPAAGFRLTWRVPLAVVAVTPAASLVLVGLLDWLSWSHAPIVVVYGVTFVWLLWAIPVLSRPPQPNPSVKGTSTSGLRPLVDAPYVER